MRSTGIVPFSFFGRKSRTKRKAWKNPFLRLRRVAILVRMYETPCTTTKLRVFKTKSTKKVTEVEKKRTRILHKWSGINRTVWTCKLQPENSVVAPRMPDVGLSVSCLSRSCWVVNWTPTAWMPRRPLFRFHLLPWRREDYLPCPHRPYRRQQYPPWCECGLGLWLSLRRMIRFDSFDRSSTSTSVPPPCRVLRGPLWLDSIDQAQGASHGDMRHY